MGTNRANDVTSHLFRACNARDIDAAVAAYGDPFVYDDRRRLSGDPIDDQAGLRAAIERICEQYSTFEAHTLAVRGERLQLARSRRSDDAGNETTYLLLTELGDDSRIAYYGRFEEDDFESAYRELEQRYYAGEGAAFAEAGGMSTDWMTALNQGDLDRIDEFNAPELRIANRSRSGFPDRSAADLRASLLDLNAIVTSAQTWHAAVCWMSAACSVSRFERTAVRADGEQYAWTKIVVTEVRDGLVASICEFDLEDEAAAFAYAEDRVWAADTT